MASLVEFLSCCFIISLRSHSKSSMIAASRCRMCVVVLQESCRMLVAKVESATILRIWTCGPNEFASQGF